MVALETPEARMAVISLSADMRLRPIRTPTSTPKGRAKGKRGRKGVEEQPSDHGRGRRGLDEQGREVVDGAQEENEDKEGAPEQRTGKDFLEDGPAEDAHNYLLLATSAGTGTNGAASPSFSARTSSMLSKSSDGQMMDDKAASERRSAMFRLEPLFT